MAVTTVTHTRTHVGIVPANPFLECDACRKRVGMFHEDECGCGVTGLMNLPCGDRADYTGRCPSWSPADGCTCREVLGHVPHPAELPTA